tara:strand:- start:543 stop:1529 length:987 start_codon:yes stop_codon:yes gene_type:complete
MIISRSPFRLTLGGGGTDLKSYYEKNGGFIFSCAINKYMYVTINKPVIDNKIRIKYSRSETVSSLKYIKHEIAKTCLEKMGIRNSIEIVSMADIPAGTGFGSSSCYTVGLLNSLHALKRNFISLQDLAEEACAIEIDILKKSIGKQDQYITTFGGFTVLNIDKKGKVKVRNANIKKSTINELRKNLLIFYTGKTRSNDKIMNDQNKNTVNKNKQTIASLDYIKESGKEILRLFEKGDISDLGNMFHSHWFYKKKLSDHISSKKFDRIYDAAIESGADGGKISGAGGGGFFVFYCNENHASVRQKMIKMGLRELEYDFDYEGTKIVTNY